MFRLPVPISLVAIALTFVGAGPGLACFGPDRGAASTNVNDHLGWAQSRDGTALSSNLAGKINALNGCGGSDDGMRDAFADLSVVIAQHAPRADCYRGDRGVGLTDRQAHRDWAGARSRQDILTNLLSKVSAATACLDRSGQARFFADISVAIAKAAEGVRVPSPAKVVWQLTTTTIKDVAPSSTKALRVDDTQLDANGGSVRITALNDGECAPGQGMPNRVFEERFLFRWRFDRDVSRIAFPDKFNVILSIEGDGIVPCFDLNPYMAVSVEGDRVLDARLSGSRYFFDTSNRFHVGGPRTVEVSSPESGLERSSVAMTPMFRVQVTGFRGNRGMQLEAQYGYTLAK